MPDYGNIKIGGGGSQGGKIAADLDGNWYIVSYPAITEKLLLYYAIAIVIIIITVYLLILLAHTIKGRK
jgi:hypothetical protein